MNKAEAIEAMKKGLKVTHRYFDKNEYARMRQYGSRMIIDPSIYFLSDEHQVTEGMFWYDRQGEEWENGWSIYANCDEL
jgi:hypothetical protein